MHHSEETSISILLAERDTATILRASYWCYVMDGGRVAHESSAKELDENVELGKRLLAGG